MKDETKSLVRRIEGNTLQQSNRKNKKTLKRKQLMLMNIAVCLLFLSKFSNSRQPKLQLKAHKNESWIQAQDLFMEVRYQNTLKCRSKSIITKSSEEIQIWLLRESMNTMITNFSKNSRKHTTQMLFQWSTLSKKEITFECRVQKTDLLQQH